MPVWDAGFAGAGFMPHHHNTGPVCGICSHLSHMSHHILRRMANEQNQMIFRTLKRFRYSRDSKQKEPLLPYHEWSLINRPRIPGTRWGPLPSRSGPCCVISHSNNMSTALGRAGCSTACAEAGVQHQITLPWTPATQRKM